MSVSTTLARSTVRQLIELGVQDYVLSPGSRNAPLSIALQEAAKENLIELKEYLKSVISKLESLSEEEIIYNIDKNIIEHMQ